MMRASMYLLSVLAQHEETQRKGCVGILFENTNHHPVRWPVEPADAFNLTDLMWNLAPIRYVGYHFCDDDPKQIMISDLESVMSAVHQLTSLRFRFHSGTSTRELDLGFIWFTSSHLNIGILLVHAPLQVR
jgi:hypothetical protein